MIFQEYATANDSHIALVTLDDYYVFISDDGVLRTHIFDWNVRDYEGAVEVNREILTSLGGSQAPEFGGSTEALLADTVADAAGDAVPATA